MISVIVFIFDDAQDLPASRRAQCMPFLDVMRPTMEIVREAEICEK